MLAVSVRVPPDMYAMIISGITISFAGVPKIKANRIVPSSPIAFAKGSSRPEQYCSNVRLPMFIFANSQIISPAGAAMLTALPRTNKVLSNTDLTMILPMSGRLKGGSSSVNDEG